MVPFAGYNMPVRYSSDIEEHMAVRNNVGVFDVSHMGEFTVKGTLQALDLIQRVTSNDASKLIDGQAQYSCLPNKTGGIVDDLIVYKNINANDYLRSGQCLQYRKGTGTGSASSTPTAQR